jgi:hypothetical protein
MYSARNWRLMSVVLLCGCTAMVGSALAQSPQAAESRSGVLVVGLDQKIGASGVAGAPRQQALAIASTVRDILERNPALANPIGFSLRIHRAFGKLTDWGHFDSDLPFYAGVFGTFFPPEEKPSPTHFGNAEFGIFVNTVLQCPLTEFTPPESSNPWRLNDNMPILQGGRRTGEIHGFAIYDGQCAIVSNSKEPPFLPVTQEQYIRLEIDTLKQRMKPPADMQNSPSPEPAIRDAIASATKQISDKIAELEQSIASMDQERRNAPAAVQTAYAETKLVDINLEGAIPLSYPNPAFFNRSLPATEVQSVAVYLPFLQSGQRAAGLLSGLSDDWVSKLQTIRDGMDWSALAALLRH